MQNNGQCIYYLHARPGCHSLPIADMPISPRQAATQMASGSGVKLATFGTDDRDRSGRGRSDEERRLRTVNALAPFSLFAENER